MLQGRTNSEFLAARVPPRGAGLLQRPANVTDLDGVLGVGDEHAELVDEIDEN